MSFTNDPVNSVIDRIRLMVGDTEEFEEGLSDEVYEYLYTSNRNNERKAALEALKMLVFKYAKYTSEVAGGVEVDYQTIYRAYRDLLDKVINDPSWSFVTVGKPFAGGLNASERMCQQSSNPFILGKNYSSSVF